MIREQTGLCLLNNQNLLKNFQEKTWLTKLEYSSKSCKINLKDFIIFRVNTEMDVIGSWLSIYLSFS